MIPCRTPRRLPLPRRAYFTISSANYLAYARTLHHSLAEAGEPAPFYLFLADDVPPALADARPGFPVVAAEDLAIPTFWDMAVRYSVMELNTAIKPFCFRYLFETEGFEEAIYLDPDVLVTRPLLHVHEALGAGADLVLTPHCTLPLEDGHDPDDLRLLRTGVYNLGFAAFRNTPQGRAFLDWWGRRLIADCRVDLDEGCFVDQKFMDLAPAYLASTRILRHPGYNVAYWNLSQRPVSRAPDGGWLAGGEPLHFFHFSGVVPGDESVFSVHQDRHTVESIGPARDILNAYLSRLERHRRLGETDTRRLPYGFAHLIDGTPLAPAMRRTYARAQPPRVLTREQAFAPDFSLFNMPAPQIDSSEGPLVSRLMYEIWLSRPDLQKLFAIGRADGRRAFARWFVQSAAREHAVPSACLDPVRRSLSSTPAHDGAADRHDETLSEMLRSATHTLAWRAPRRVGRHVKRAYRRAGRPFERTVSDQPSRPPSLKVDPARPFGVGLYGYLRTESGVGEGARRAAACLEAAGIPYSAHALSTPQFLQSLEPGFPLSDAPSPWRFLICHVNADQSTGLTDTLGAGALEGRYRIGYWAWELARFPDAWRAAFDLYHEIWAPSRFVANAIAAASPRPVHVMPHAIPAHDGERRSGRAHLQAPDDAFVFLSAFDTNSFTSRKNPLGAIKAFEAAFDAGGENVRLVLKVHGRARDRRLLDRLFEAMQKDPRISIIDAVLPERAMRDLQAGADAFVSLHRSEGFGLNIAEMMAAEKPVIATAYSGCMDFMDETNSLAIPYSLVPVAPGAYPHGEGQEWAEPDLGAAAEAMRRLAGDRDLATRLGQKAKITMETRFLPETIGRQIVHRLKTIDHGCEEQATLNR